MSAERGDRPKKERPPRPDGFGTFAIGGDAKKGTRPLITGGIFQKGDADGVINIPPIVRYRGKRERNVTQENTLDDTIKVLTTLERIKKLQESGTLTDEDAEKFTAQAMESLEGKTNKDDKAFTGMAPGILRGMRRTYQWTAEKAIKKIEEHAEKEEEAKEIDDPNKSKLEDPQWDDERGLWKGSRFNRPTEPTDMTGTELVLNPNPSLWKFGGDTWIKVPVALPDDRLPSQKTLHEKEVPETKEAGKPEEPASIQGSRTDGITGLYRKNPDVPLYDLMRFIADNDSTS